MRERVPGASGHDCAQNLPARQGLLAACLVAMFVVQPLVTHILPGFKLLIEIFLVLVLVAAAYAFVGRRTIFILMLGLQVLGLALMAWSMEHGSSLLRLAGGLLLFCFLALTVYALQARLWCLTSISIDAVVVAFNGYLILGMAWGLLFMCTEMAFPGSFSLGAAGELPTSILAYTNQQWSSFFYLSMVTITTVGYGDVTPISALARNLAVLEAVLGQFYLAVVVARLVGLVSARGRGSAQP